MLMTHYREPIDFTVKRLEEAETKLRDWQRAAQGATLTESDGPDQSVIKELADDLGFHRATVALDVIAKKANRDGGDISRHCLAATLRFLGFGLDTLLATEADTAEPPHLATAIADRLAALNAKDFAKADAIRTELADQGITLMDYKDEAGARQTKWEIKR